MIDYKTRMVEDMTLCDFRPRTQQAYLMGARQLVEYVGKPPEEISEEDIRAYFLYLREVKKSASATIKIAIYGVRFLFMHTLEREWKIFGLLGARQPAKLPVVLAIDEVRDTLKAIKKPTHRTAMATIYALGLRISECLRLQTDHIDGKRLTVWVRDGKGKKDRGVTLPKPTLELLRAYWKNHRPKRESPIIFLRRDGHGPMHPTTLQKTIKLALKDAGINKAASVHSLRHSYATHLLEAGISVSTVQLLLGHKTLRTTERYFHVTRPATENLQRTLDQLMADL